MLLLLEGKIWWQLFNFPWELITDHVILYGFSLMSVFTFAIMIIELGQFVGNKAKWQILKRMFQENKTHQIFRKKTFLTP